MKYDTSAIEAIIQKIEATEKQIFESALRENAQPPLKGEITAGKLIYRGIKLVRQLNGDECTSWLEQRGERISKKFHFDGLSAISLIQNL